MRPANFVTHFVEFFSVSRLQVLSQSSLETADWESCWTVYEVWTVPLLYQQVAAVFHRWCRWSGIKITIFTFTFHKFGQCRSFFQQVAAVFHRWCRWSGIEIASFIFCKLLYFRQYQFSSNCPIRRFSSVHKFVSWGLPEHNLSQGNFSWE